MTPPSHVEVIVTGVAADAVLGEEPSWQKLEWHIKIDEGNPP